MNKQPPSLFDLLFGINEEMLRRDPNKDHMLTPEQVKKQEAEQKLYDADCSRTIH